MDMCERENSRFVKINKDLDRIRELERWLKLDYPERLNTINRYNYLGVPCKHTRYALEIEAYNKENELRRLRGMPELPAIKYKNIF